MTRAELIQQIALRFPHLTTQDVDLAVRSILDKISETMSAGNKIEIRGFGSFSLNYRPPRKGRNPKSGATVMVPAKYAPRFKPGLELRERVDYLNAKAR